MPRPGLRRIHIDELSLEDSVDHLWMMSWVCAGGISFCLLACGTLEEVQELGKFAGASRSGYVKNIYYSEVAAYSFALCFGIICNFFEAPIRQLLTWLVKKGFRRLLYNVLDICWKAAGLLFIVILICGLFFGY